MRISPCTHQQDALTCHNRPELPCPQHFSAAVGDVMAAVAHHDNETATVALLHLLGHRWLGSAVMTWCTLINRFVGEPGETPEQTVQRMQTQSVEAMPPDMQEWAAPWMFRLQLMIRSACLGDGPMIIDAFQSAMHDDAMDPGAVLSIVASLALTAHDAIANRDEVTAGTIAAYCTAGSQASTADAFTALRMVGPIIEGFRDNTAHDDTPAMKPRMEAVSDCTQDVLLTAVALVSRSLGQFLDPAGITLFTTDGHGDTAGAGVTGMIIGWDDPSLDHARTTGELVHVRAVRAAMSYGRGTPQDLAEVLESGGYDYALDTILGCCSIIGMMLAETEAEVT